MIPLKTVKDKKVGFQNFLVKICGSQQFCKHEKKTLSIDFQQALTRNVALN